MVAKITGDTYIDYFEVGEYGDHFVSESTKLDGASPLVNIPALRDRVASAVAAVNSELTKAGVKRSELRGGQDETGAASASARKEIERFFNYLGSLDDDVAFDMEAFFAGGKLGGLSQLKPADVRARADEVLDGFEVGANKALPEGAKWKTKLEKARADLAAAIAGKSSAKAVTFTGNADLAAARERFLKVYSVAKRLVQAMLIDLGREDEYRLFFADLQVNERSAKKPASEEK